MHNLDPPMKYKHKTRIGNWSEEWELEETKMKDYLYKKQTSILESTVRDNKISKSLQQASLTYSADGSVKFGDHVMFFNEKTQGFLAANINDKIQGDENAFGITTAKGLHPCQRSVFVIQRYDKEQDYYNDDKLHFGQKFRIAINPRQSDVPLYLNSQTITPQKCAKFSRYQEANMSSINSFNTVWTFQYADPKCRFEMDKQPIKANQPIILQHVFTSQWLASDLVPYNNIFGPEYETFCHSFLNHNKTQNLIAEKTGRSTIDIPMRNQLEPNIWSVVTADDPNLEFDEVILDKTDKIEDLMSKLKHQLVQMGTYGFKGLIKGFRKLDKNNVCKLDPEDFKWGLRNYGIYCTDEEIKLLVKQFDADQSGTISFQGFFEAIAGPLSDKRKAWVESCYAKVSQATGGNVTVESLAKIYNAKKHPDVQKGYITEKEAFKAYISAWDTPSPDTPISEEQFACFYRAIGASTDKDDIFEVIVKNVYGI